MSCERYTAAIVDHACGADLPVDARAHLAGCAKCGALFDEQRRLLGALDAELSAAIAIDPSPQFAPRVRAAIEATAVASPRHRWFWWGGLAATATAAAIVASWPSIDRVPSPSAAVVSAPRLEERQSPVERVVPPLQPVERANSSGPVHVKTQPPRNEPEIIVSSEQRIAVERYVTMFRAGSLETSALAVSPQAELTLPSELVVAPLEVEPIAGHGADLSTNAAVERRHD